MPARCGGLTLRGSILRELRLRPFVVAAALLIALGVELRSEAARADYGPVLPPSAPEASAPVAPSVPASPESAPAAETSPGPGAAAPGASASPSPSPGPQGLVFTPPPLPQFSSEVRYIQRVLESGFSPEVLSLLVPGTLAVHDVLIGKRRDDPFAAAYVAVRRAFPNAPARFVSAVSVIVLVRGADSLDGDLKHMTLQLQHTIALERARLALADLSEKQSTHLQATLDRRSLLIARLSELVYAIEAPAVARAVPRATKK